MSVQIVGVIVVSQMEYFQDDIYPETRVWWESALTCQEWLAGQDKMQPSLSLRPPDMKTCKVSNKQYSYTFYPYIFTCLPISE